MTQQDRFPEIIPQSEIDAEAGFQISADAKRVTMRAAFVCAVAFASCMVGFGVVETMANQLIKSADPSYQTLGM